jgi:putative adhesin
MRIISGLWGVDAYCVFLVRLADQRAGVRGSHGSMTERWDVTGGVEQSKRGSLVDGDLLSAAADRDARRHGRLRVSRWALLLAGSLLVLVAAAVVLAVLWLSTSKTTSFVSQLSARPLGIELRVQSGDVAVVGGSQSGVSISRSDDSVFGHGPHERRSISAGVIHISSSCPRLVIGHCRANYRLDVPDSVPISIRAENGAVHLVGYHGSADIATDGGAISVEGYCGFVLGAASASGDISVSATCSPERLTLRSDTGDVIAVVPAGSYRIQAASNSGATSVEGVSNDDGAPWAIQALSNSGSVRVTGGS